MPKQTFFNLPDEKRRRVIEAALDEFAAYPFRQASVGRIIKNSGIASGSFYQYFNDKLDLYSHLLEVIGEVKMRYIAPLLSDKDMSFFELFRKLYAVGGMQFARENPKMEALSGHLMRDKDTLSRHLKEYEPMAIEFYGSLLERGIASGELRRDMDVPKTSYLLMKLGIALGEKILEQGRLSDDYMGMVDIMLDFIKNGIGNNRR